jgi:hypothetical protein
MKKMHKRIEISQNKLTIPNQLINLTESNKQK